MKKALLIMSYIMWSALFVGIVYALWRLFQ